MAKRTPVEISDAQFEAAIQILADKGTKKLACEALGIAYNVKRLADKIEEYLDKRDRTARMRKQKRGTTIQPDEGASILELYFAGDAVSVISERFYRPNSIVKNYIESKGANLRAKSADYFNPSFIPDQCIGYSFEAGEVAWSAKHNCTVEILVVNDEKEYASVWVSGEHAHKAYIEFFNLGKMSHIADQGVDISRLVTFPEGVKCRELPQVRRK